MTLIIASFLAGIFSVLAPCILPMLPVLLTSTVRGESRERNPLWLIAGLSISVVVFSVALKSTTLLISIPSDAWKIVSGVIVSFYGLFMIWPSAWEVIVRRTGLFGAAYEVSARAEDKRGVYGDVLFGASLGPIFSVCSPTYALIVASILPASPAKGLLYLISYVLGLSLMLFVAARGGRAVVRRLGWGINPRGSFRRIIGVILLAFGILIISGIDKQLLSWLVSSGLFDWQVNLENTLQ